MDLGMHVDATVHSISELHFPSLDRISLEIYRSRRNSRRNSLGIYD